MHLTQVAGHPIQTNGSQLQYVMGSIQSSYADNRSYGFQSLSGPWSSQADVAPQAVRTYFSQNAYDLPLGSNAIYMGDRWRPDLLGSSRYVWYPLDFSSGSPTLVHADVWSVNLQSGRGFVKSRFRSAPGLLSVARGSSRAHPQFDSCRDLHRGKRHVL